MAQLVATRSGLCPQGFGLRAALTGAFISSKYSLLNPQANDRLSQAKDIAYTSLASPSCCGPGRCPKSMLKTNLGVDTSTQLPQTVCEAFCPGGGVSYGAIEVQRERTVDGHLAFAGHTRSCLLTIPELQVPSVVKAILKMRRPRPRNVTPVPWISQVT